MRKLIIFAGLVLLIAGGIGIWRSMNPPLSDEEQITAHIEGITKAASAKRLSGIMTYLDKDFKYGTMSRKDVQTALAGGFWQYRKLDVNVSGVKVKVTGDTAASEGHYTIGLQRENNSSPETYAGDFKLKWKKQDGEWKAIEGEGGQLPLF